MKVGQKFKLADDKGNEEFEDTLAFPSCPTNLFLMFFVKLIMQSLFEFSSAT